MGEVFLLALLAFFAVFAVMSIKIVPQSEIWLVEQFGRYKESIEPGINFIVPVLNNVTARISIKERQLQLAKEIGVITKDNVDIGLQLAVFWRILDAAKSHYRIDSIDSAVWTTANSTVRAICGQLDFDDVQSRREYINREISQQLSVACQIWGIEITRTEILDVKVDNETKKAMQQQLNAERERRAKVLAAEGEKTAQQLKADGEFYAAQKEAEGKRVLAEADAYATTIVGQAIRESGQAALDFEIRKQQVASLAQLASSENSKLIMIPTEVTSSWGGLLTAVEAFSTAQRK